MKTFQVLLCFLVNFLWIFFAVGLECPVCIHISKGTVTPDEQSILDIIQLPESFGDAECEKDVDARKSTIQIEKCIDSNEMVTRCGNFSGLVNATIVFIKLPVKLYHRGCYYFEESKVPEYGCQKRINVAEDIHLINKTLSHLASIVPLLNEIRVNNVEGELCLYTGAAGEIAPKSVTKNAITTRSVTEKVVVSRSATEKAVTSRSVIEKVLTSKAVTKNKETPKATVNAVSGVNKGALLSSFSVLGIALFALVVVLHLECCIN